MLLLILPLFVLFLPTNHAQYNPNQPSQINQQPQQPQQQTNPDDIVKAQMEQYQPPYGRFQPSVAIPFGVTSNQQDNCCQEYCYAEDENPYTNFGTKTPYEIVYGKQSNQHRVAECTPIQFWSLNRHGTRYPGKDIMSRLRDLSKIRDEIVRNYEERRSYPDRGRLCLADYQLIKNWHWNQSITENLARALTQQGIDDLKYLARRYRTRFQEIFQEPYSERAYNFQYDDTDFTHDSFQAFIDGLFQQNSYQVHANLRNDKHLVEPISACKSWQYQIYNTSINSYEIEAFKQQQVYQEMVRDVFRRLGFRYTLNDSIVQDMYDMCRFEKAWNLHQKSPWCLAFNKDQLKIMEYIDDLIYYYDSGYGNKMAKKLGCPAVKDMYERFQRTIDGDRNGEKVNVYFSHSSAILPLLTTLGLYEDYLPLKGDNYYQQTNRQWRTSQINPFAANFVATLYECRSGERNRVMFFLNEIPVNYPDCAVGLCNWSTIKRKFENIADECNLDFCDQQQNHSNGLGITKITIVTFFVIFLYFTDLF